jgi:heptaprenyl diphosphate synthase
VVSTGDPTPRELVLSSLGLDVDPAMDESVSATLAAVEVALRGYLTSADPLVAEAASHLAEAGGKRFRPLLVALGAQFGDPSSPQVVDASNVIELTHLATLYHDDVMDEALVRRGAPSANARWGNSVAILVGDYLFAQAADLAATLGTEAVHVAPTRSSTTYTSSRRRRRP